MKRALAFVAVGSVAVGAGILALGVVAFGVVGRDHAVGPEASSPWGSAVADATAADSDTALASLERRLEVAVETRRSRGAFALRGGRRLRVQTADTSDGKSCLMDFEDSSGVAGAMCLEDGLFAEHRAAFSVSSNGGPRRFGELYLLGVAAPDVVSVAVVKSDGSAVDVRLNRDGAFLFESTPSDLQQDVLPAGLRLFGAGGRLVEKIDIPGLR